MPSSNLNALSLSISISISSAICQRIECLTVISLYEKRKEKKTDTRINMILIAMCDCRDAVADLTLHTTSNTFLHRLTFFALI